MEITPIDPTYYFNIVVLTGAGISVASGIRPYRGPDGLWNETNIQEYAHAKTMAADPGKVWNFFAPLRSQLKQTSPNKGHFSLAKFEASLRQYHSFMLVTQNIDGLHNLAGSKNVVEMHGNINRTRCTNDQCKLQPYPDTEPHLDQLPRCSLCGSPLRMDIVLFGEGVDSAPIKDRLRGCDLFIAVGTSGVVYPAAGFAQLAKSYGARTILINLEELESPTTDFHEVILGKAEEILPRLLNVK